MIVGQPLPPGNAYAAMTARLCAMKPESPLVDLCLELLAPLGRPRSRRMFGGHGIYVDELFIALITDDGPYLKADTLAQPAFVAAGCQSFSYQTKAGRQGVMAYWSAPSEALESPALMLPWARLAIDSALRAAAAKRPAKPRQSAAAKAKSPAAKARCKPTGPV